MTSTDTTDDQRRSILEAVARGELSPAEAADRLRALQEPSAAAPAPDAPAPPAGEGVRRIRVEATAGTVVVIGDPDVREAVVEGPHKARREGDLLVVEHQPFEVDEEDGDDRGFVFVSGRGKRINIRKGSVLGPGSRVVVRVNRMLPVEVLAQAGSAKLRDVHGPVKADVSAGSLRIDDFRGPLECVVNAGSLKGRGILAGGESNIRCEAGSVDLHLERGSNVRIGVKVNLGQLSVQTPNAPVGDREFLVGTGEGRLDISANLGRVRVHAD